MRFMVCRVQNFTLPKILGKRSPKFHFEGYPEGTPLFLHFHGLFIELIVAF